MGKSIKFRQQRGQLVCTNLLAAKVVPQGGVCRQGKRWENQSSSDNKEVSECAQTYILHRLCHRVLFPGKERDGKINQVQTTKRSVSVYKLTFCMDCATGYGLQTRKEMGKSIKFRQQRGQLVCTNLLAAKVVPQGGVCRQGKRWENQSSSDNKEVSECAQTYILHRLCHRVLFPGKERDGKINQVQTTKRSVSVYKLTFCMDCATGYGLQTRKEMGKSIKFRQQRGQLVCTNLLPAWIVPQDVVCR